MQTACPLELAPFDTTSSSPEHGPAVLTALAKSAPDNGQHFPNVVRSLRRPFMSSRHNRAHFTGTGALLTLRFTQMADQNGSRIAIRFGGASTNGPKNAPKNASRPTPSTALGKRSRSGFDHVSNGDESEEERHETITHFGVNGAGNDDDDDGRPREGQSKSGGRRRRSQSRDSTANSSRQDPAQPNQDHVEEEEPLQYGLVLSKKPKRDAGKDDGDKDGADKTALPKNADEEAMAALMESGGKRALHRTEDEAYRDATADAPEVDDVATYDAFPVEGFGEALLKGQGWDGQMRGPKAKEIKKRPNGIGLGAKKMTVEEDLGGWDNKGKTTEKRPRLDQYRSERDKERSRREDRHRDSYKNERDRERDRDRDRPRDRHRDRDRDAYRHRDREYRR